MNLRLQIKVALTLILISFVFCAQKANAQVGIGTTTPDNSAMLEIKSSNKGILIPRLTSVQRTAISAPAKGLMVFDNDSTCFYYYDGSAWKPLKTETSYTAGTGIGITGGNVVNAQTTTALWNANKLQGKTISTTAPTAGQTLKWNGTSWTPGNDSTVSYSAGTGTTLTGTTFSAQTTSALWNANELQGTSLSSTAPTSGQVLKYNSTTSKWEPNTDNNTTYTGGNAVNVSGTTVNLGGNLTGATTIGTSSTNTLKLTGVQSGASTDSLMVISNGVLKKVAVSTDVPTYTASNGATMSANNVVLGGNLTGATTIGTSSSNTLKLTGVQAGATSDSVMVISNGVLKKVAQSSIAGTTYTASTGMTLTGSAFSANTTSALWNANQLQGTSLSTTTPTSGQVLKYNSTTSKWEPNTDNNTTYTASNGVNVSGTNVSLGGALTGATTIGTSSTNTLKLTGIQSGASTDSLMVISSGVVKKVAVSTDVPAYTANNGATMSGNNVVLGGALTSATTIGTSSSNTLKLTGVQTGATSDSLMLLSNGVVKKIAVATVAPTYTYTNGVNASGTTVSLGGNLANATTIGTSSTNTLKLTGVQSGASTDSLMVISSGVVKKVAVSTDVPAYSASTGMTLTGSAFSANTTSALWNANQLEGKSVSTTAPTSGQVLKFNGTSWTPGNDSVGTFTATNGLTLSGTKELKIGGSLTAATTIGTSSTNTLKLTGIQAGASTDSLMVISNGILKKVAVSTDVPAYTASNGATMSGNNVVLGGNLSGATTIGTSSSNTLKLTGVQTGATSDSVMMLSSGVVKKIATSSITGTTYTGNNGVGISGTTVSLGGNLANATTIGTSSSNTLKLTGVQAGATSDSVMVISNGVLKKVAQSSIAGTTYTASTGMTLTGSAFSAQTTTALWNANQLQGTSLSTTTPTSGQVLKYNSTTSKWEPNTDNNTTYTGSNGVGISGTTVSLGGALANATTIGTSSTNTLKLTGIQAGASTDSLMVISSGVVKKVAVSTDVPAYTASTGMTLTGSAFSANTTTALWNANQLQGRTLSSTAPTSGQTLKWNGTSWTPGNDSTVSYTGSNGLTLSGTTFKMGGNLANATTIGTSSTNTLKLTGIQTGATTDSVMMISSGVLKKIATSSITGTTYSAGNGMNLSGTTMNWGGNLSAATTIGTSSTNTLKLTGIQAGASTDSVMVISSGVVKKVAQSTVGSSTGQWTTSGSNIYNANSGNVGVNTSSPNASLDIKGSLAVNRTAISSGYSSSSTAYNVAATDHIVAITFSPSGKVYIQLPLASSSNVGREIIIKSESGTTSITLQTPTTSSQTIDGSSSLDLDKFNSSSAPYYSVIRVYSNGSNWFIY